MLCLCVYTFIFIFIYLFIEKRVLREILSVSRSCARTHYFFDSKIFTRMCLLVDLQHLCFASLFYYFFIFFILRSVFQQAKCFYSGSRAQISLSTKLSLGCVCHSVPSVWVLRLFVLFCFFFFRSMFQQATCFSNRSHALFIGPTDLFYSTKFLLKINPTALFIHLKIIFLQCF